MGRDISHGLVKGLVHPIMKVTPWFTHPQAILGVYDFIISDKYNLLYNGSGQVFIFF